MIRNDNDSAVLLQNKTLSRMIGGMVMTLRNLHNRNNDEVPVSKTLAIQRFLRELDKLGTELKRMDVERTSIRSKLRRLRIARMDHPVRSSIK